MFKTKLKPSFILFFGLLAYLPLLSSYFTLDEWGAFLYFYHLSDKELFRVLASFFVAVPGQYLPITQVITYSMFFFFKLNYLSYFLAGMFLHYTAGITLFYLLKLITKNYGLSLTMAFVFIIAPHHFQATSWVVANIGYTLSADFLLFGLFFYFKWLNKSEIKKALIVSSMFFLSLLSKDITSFIIVGLPIITFIWSKRLQKTFFSILIVLPSAFLEIWHFWYLKTHPLSILLVNSTPGFRSLISLPLREIVQSLVPQHAIYFLAKVLLFFVPPFNFVKFKTTAFNLDVESIGSEIIVYVLFLLIILMTVYCYRKYKKYFKLYITGIILTGLSGLSYLFVDTKNFTLLQPRYVYIGVLLISISVLPFLKICQNLYKKNTTALLALLIMIYFSSTFFSSYKQAKIGVERKKILDYINNSIPYKQNNLVLFLQSDTSYYGMSEKVKLLPFEMNSGKVLAVYLFNKIHLPNNVYPYDTLRDLSDEDYFSDDVGSFGYFWDYDVLQSSVKKYRINPQAIFSFKYIGKEQKIIDQSDDIRKKLESD